MNIENYTVKKTAKLAKLKFNNQEIELLGKELSSIMNMIDSLNEVDCSKIEPLTSVCEMYQRTRVDDIEASDVEHETEHLFANVRGTSAKLAKELKCFIVPKVIEKVTE